VGSDSRRIDRNWPAFVMAVTLVFQDRRAASAALLVVPGVIEASPAATRWGRGP
jgi:hypothetical protein